MNIMQVNRNLWPTAVVFTDMIVGIFFHESRKFISYDNSQRYYNPNLIKLLFIIYFYRVSSG